MCVDINVIARIKQNLPKAEKKFKLQLLKKDSISELCKRLHEQKLPEFSFDTYEMFCEHLKKSVKAAAPEALEEVDTERRKYENTDNVRHKAL